MSKNILLVGEWASPNLGDAVLCNCCYNILKYNTLNNYIKFDLSFGANQSDTKRSIYSYLCVPINFLGGKKATRILGWIRSKLFIKNGLRKHKNIDGIVFCGGQIILDYFCDCVNEIAIYAEKRSIPIIYNAIGGSQCSNHSKIIFKRVLEKNTVKAISIRDNYHFFSNLTSRDIKVVPDIAVSAGKIYEHQSNNSNIIGLGTINPVMLKERLGLNVSLDEIISFWSKVIQNIENKGLKWKFFTNGDIGDFNSAKSILESLGYVASEKFLQDRPRTDTELISNISQFSAIISFRLHSHIISYSLGIPSFGLIWDKKVVDFFNMTNNKYYSAENIFDTNKISEFLDEYGHITVNNSLTEIAISNLTDNVKLYF